MRRRLAGCLVALLVLGVVLRSDVRAAGLQAKATGFKRAGASLRVRFEVQDLFSDRFRRAVEQGTTLYLRLEVELWEARTVWDRLVRPATVSVARLATEPRRSVVLVDSFGEATRYSPYPDGIGVWADLVPIDRVDDARSYYVHATVTVGTIAEHEISGVGDTLFGEDRQASSLGSIGKFFVEKVLRLADYLDSSSCDVKSGKLAGRELKR